MNAGRKGWAGVRDAVGLPSCELLFRSVESRTLPRHGAVAPRVEGSVEIDRRDDGVLVVRHVVTMAFEDGVVEETTTASYYRIEDEGGIGCSSER